MGLQGLRLRASEFRFKNKAMELTKDPCNGQLVFQSDFAC